MTTKRRKRTRLTRRQVLGAIVGTGLGLAGAPTLARAAKRRRVDRPPNIVVILSDNHRWDAMSSMRHPFVRTPNMDRIGREGVHFANAFCTTPLCSPARASFLTGLYAYRHGVRNNADQSSWDETRATFLELLKRQAGYDTAFVGKWHMPSSGLPRLRGVDRFVTFTVNDGQGRYFDCPLVVDGTEQPSKKRYITEELTDRAIAFVERKRSAPFCLYLSHKAVHHPWQPAPGDEGIYRKEEVPMPPGANSWTGFTNGQIWGGFDRSIESAYRSYMETTTSLDREIGRLLRRLQSLGCLDDTVVVYTSDNGFLFGEHNKVELRWPFEEVLRIPFLLRYPRIDVRPGRRTQMALNIDLAPTLLDLAGVAVPDEMQGSSLAPVLGDPAAAGRRAWLVENYKEFPYRTPTYRGVHTRRYLYVEYENALDPSLHDVVEDPQQSTNLIGTPQGDRIAVEMRRLLATFTETRSVDA